ncbi:MAG TPA: sporulation protein YtfJ [Candidatus Faeciplasma pullistercoris]|uniref:Sporulation protein YtfJ n=1 Tax=Candidatus Faeciplasma pullistercoris TaxID=2840800 RepID=A0A9D1GVA1_9FIRM|nr:sporulation protein YtfJ [Candidatus Faeciplasma pullistercoris]
MNEKNSYLENLVKGAIEKIKEMVDVQTIIGEPVVAPNGTVIVPVSKVSIGFGSGGSDLPTKNAKDLFGGGVGGGVTISPVAFIVIAADGSVKLLQLTVNAPKENAALALVPDIVEKITSMIGKDKNKEESSKEETYE